MEDCGGGGGQILRSSLFLHRSGQQLLLLWSQGSRGSGSTAAGPASLPGRLPEPRGRQQQRGPPLRGRWKQRRQTECPPGLGQQGPGPGRSAAPQHPAGHPGARGCGLDAERSRSRSPLPGHRSSASAGRWADAAAAIFAAVLLPVPV
ncbi:hypothetical protein CRUP_017206 [Coryphaenoides rupestris]|nr:hypothetical protein CRUP_017206 [Coryphaenoides rupestris]